MLTRCPLQAELDSVVGQNRHPSIADRPALPYTEAVLMEVQRYANIVPNGVQHVNSRDITVNGVTIPARTMIQPLLTNLLKVCAIPSLVIQYDSVCQILCVLCENPASWYGLWDVDRFDICIFCTHTYRIKFCTDNNSTLQYSTCVDGIFRLIVQTFI